MAIPQKPWWRDWRQLPPGSTPGGGDEPLTRGVVWVVRLLMVAELAALVAAALTHTPVVGVLLLPGIALATKKLSPQQRHQVFGRWSGA